jgi:hypothetical protein
MIASSTQSSTVKQSPRDVGGGRLVPDRNLVGPLQQR